MTIGVGVASMGMKGRAMRRSWKALFAVAAMAAIGVLFGPLIYARIETALLRYGVTGIDVSNHQGDIDWRALAAHGVDFAYIKATEGGDFRDRRFQQNWSAAKAAGIARGAYHFFRQCKSGADQAANFIAAVPKETGALPPVIDAEHMGPCPAGQTVPDVKAEVLAFMTLVEAHYGRRPIIYVTAEFDQAYLAGDLAGETFWVRSLFLPPSIREQNWLFWQYHHRGQRPGVNGPVDLNAFRGSRADFLAFAASSR